MSPAAGSGTPRTTGRERDVDVLLLDSKAIKDKLAAAEVAQRALAEAVGGEGEDSYGKPIGTGLAGRLGRLERQLLEIRELEKTWRARAWAFGVSGSFFIAVIGWLLAVVWSLVKTPIGEMLK